MRQVGSWGIRVRGARGAAFAASTSQKGRKVDENEFLHKKRVDDFLFLHKAEQRIKGES